MGLGIDIRIVTRMKANERLKKRKSGGSDRLRKGFIKAALIYRRAMQRRHAKNARGGGTWKRKADGTLPILRKTDTLYKELSQSRSKGRITVSPDLKSVSVDYSDRRHPEFKGTIARLAEIHHFGTETIPARKLLIQARGELRERMTNELRKAIRDIIRGKR